MSEYQYYEFRAIDTPLDTKAMAKLRQITSRAEITESGLVNEYHWGDFKGDPDKLMEKYFDAHLYFANWGTHRLMLRVPRSCLEPTLAEPFCVADRVRVVPAGANVVLDFWSPEERYEDEWRDWKLAELLPLRADVMAGDLCCLYLAWLSGVENGEIDEDEIEPPVPAGLKKMSGPLRAFAEFLYLDQDLIAAAADVSEAASAEPSSEQMEAWIGGLSEEEKNHCLLRVMKGEGIRVAGQLMTRFRRAARAESTDAPGPGRRTAGQLLAAVEGQRQRREQKEAAKAEQERARLEKKRAAHLDSLRGREDELWRKVEDLVETKKSQNYDEAVSLLRDLRDLEERGGNVHFTQSLRGLFVRHSSKSAFKRKVNAAGLGG